MDHLPIYTFHPINIPYKVLDFIWNRITGDTKIKVKISKDLIQENNDITTIINLRNNSTDPRLYYNIKSDICSINRKGDIFVDEEKMMGINPMFEGPQDRRPPQQWEFDRHTFNRYDSDKYTSPGQVWEAVSKFIKDYLETAKQTKESVKELESVLLNRSRWVACLSDKTYSSINYNNESITSLRITSSNGTNYKGIEILDDGCIILEIHEPQHDQLIIDSSRDYQLKRKEAKKERMLQRSIYQIFIDKEKKKEAKQVKRILKNNSYGITKNQIIANLKQEKDEYRKYLNEIRDERAFFKAEYRHERRHRHEKRRI